MFGKKKSMSVQEIAAKPVDYDSRVKLGTKELYKLDSDESKISWLQSQIQSAAHRKNERELVLCTDIASNFKDAAQTPESLELFEQAMKAYHSRLDIS